jgi:hypothetical protein
VSILSSEDPGSGFPAIDVSACQKESKMDSMTLSGGKSLHSNVGHINIPVQAC